MATVSRRPHVRLRQVALFVLSMIVPSVVLIGVGIRMIVQQDELAEKHAADERRLLVSDFERELVTGLDRIRQNPKDPAVAIAGTLADGRLLLPWDRASDAAGDVGFREAISSAEQAEFGTGRLALAESLARGALARAGTDSDRAYARLVLARVLVKAHRQIDAEREYRQLLGIEPTVTDDNGVPISLYAAGRLLDTVHLDDSDRAALERAVDGASRRSPMLPPAAWYQLRSISSKLSETALQTRINDTIADVEHALALQQDIQTLLAQWRSSDSAWLAHGRPVWLVGVGPQSSTGRTVLAVRADMVFVSASASATGRTTITIVSATTPGEWLGDRFPGVRVSFPDTSLDAQSQRSVQRAFYLTALVIVLSVTLFGSYLLFRDIRRDMRLSALRSQFVSSVSHELKTPLTAIRMFAETLQLRQVDAAMRHEYLDTIVNESERLTRLLNNVLDFSKIEQGDKAYRRAPASLADIVRVAARTMTYPLEQQGFELKVEVDDALPPLSVDADAVEQAILNLLTNAMKYSGDGRTIGLRLARDGDAAVVSVQDAGFGIAPLEQRRIFEKFYRVASPENERIPGTGLGLTLVDHIVKAHEGTVRVASALGRGSTFSIRLPLETPALAPAEATL